MSISEYFIPFTRMGISLQEVEEKKKYTKHDKLINKAPHCVKMITLI